MIMRRIIPFLKNWRYYVMYAIMSIAMLLLFAESESIMTMFMTKVFALVLILVHSALFSHWQKKNRIPELIELIKFLEEE